VKDQLAGCVALGPHDHDWLLEHFYIAPQFQGHGLGSLALSSLITQADQAQKTITLSVLQQSDAASFYERHGFHKTGEDEWDIYYARMPVISRES
jgi:ribosomal protein S18 acetylase RimI-like enzyme